MASKLPMPEQTLGWVFFSKAEEFSLKKVCEL